MQAALNEIKSMIERGMVHRKGYQINKVSDRFIIGRMRDELEELDDMRNDEQELADVLGCLLHYVVLKGWSLSHLEMLMLAKFRNRFYKDDIEAMQAAWADGSLKGAKVWVHFIRENGSAGEQPAVVKEISTTDAGEVELTMEVNECSKWHIDALTFRDANKDPSYD